MTSAVRTGTEFAELSRTMHQSGLLDRRRVHYGFRIAFTVALYAAGVAAFFTLGETWWQVLTAVFFGFAFTQTAFLGHDAGHKQIFRSNWANDLLGFVLGNLLVGLSFGWWKAKHTAHHRNPNHEDLDPDVAPGVLAFTDSSAVGRSRFLRGVHRHQAFYFIPLLLLEGLNLHVAGFQAIRSGRLRRSAMELSMLVVHTVAYLGALFVVLSPLQALVFIGVHQGVFGLYMGASFAPNHKGMPIITAADRKDFFRNQVLTARNVRGGRVTDYALGGLNYQIEHHLFPSMPRPNLRHAQHIIREFCAKHEVAYHQTSLLHSYRLALQSLHATGAPLRGATVSVA